LTQDTPAGGAPGGKADRHDRTLLAKVVPVVSGSAFERLETGRDEVAVQPKDGGAISTADYALGFVDLIEEGDHHRAQVNLGH
jgi:putative NADH-flavin reductase